MVKGRQNVRRALTFGLLLKRRAVIKVRNMDDRRDQEMTMTDYLKYVAAVAGISQPGGTSSLCTVSIRLKGCEEQSLLYAKDAVCPDEWENWMRKNLTSSLLPYDKGDLGSHLPPDVRPLTMCAQRPHVLSYAPKL